jgi:hypothetical protein
MKPSFYAALLDGNFTRNITVLASYSANLIIFFCINRGCSPTS